MFTETSAQCVAKGALRSDSLKMINYKAEDQFQPMTVKREGITVSPQAQYQHCVSGRLIYRGVGLMSPSDVGSSFD